jgi:MraZ protein
VGETVFQGATQVNLDAKGRMAVPTRARDPLTAGGTVKLVLTAHPHGCLLLFPMPAWEPIRAQVMSFPSTNPHASLWKRLLVGFAEEVEPDGAGRLLISPELRDYAKITRPVMFVGQGSHFEIWDLESWKAQFEVLKTGGAASLPPGMETFSL